MGPVQISWTRDGDRYVSPIGWIAPRGSLVDVGPNGPLLGKAPAIVVGLMNLDCALDWFRRTCESLGVDVAIEAL